MLKMVLKIECKKWQCEVENLLKTLYTNVGALITVVM